MREQRRNFWRIKVWLPKTTRYRSGEHYQKRVLHWRLSSTSLPKNKSLSSTPTFLKLGESTLLFFQSNRISFKRVNNIVCMWWLKWKNMCFLFPRSSSATELLKMGNNPPRSKFSQFCLPCRWNLSKVETSRQST